VFQKKCTKFKHHFFATVLSYTTELCRFQQNVQKENVYTIKGSVWIRQLNSLFYSAGKWTIWKQSSRLGDTSRFAFALAYMRSYWLLEGISVVKKSFHQRTKYNLSCSETYVSSNACMHSIVSVCLLLSRTELGVKNYELQIVPGNPHNWRMWNSSLSHDSRGLLLALVQLVFLVGCKLSH